MRATQAKMSVDVAKVTKIANFDNCCCCFYINLLAIYFVCAYSNLMTNFRVLVLGGRKVCNKSVFKIYLSRMHKVVRYGLSRWECKKSKTMFYNILS